MAKKKFRAFCLGLVLLWSFSNLLPFAGVESVLASPGNLRWSVVDTPSEEGNVVVSPGEVNAFVLGSDDKTVYAIDIPGDLAGGTYPDGKVYRSTDGGITWKDDLTAALITAGAALPAWDIAVSPSNPEVVAVVTDNRTAVYVSENVSAAGSWVNSRISSSANWNAGLFIADIAISLNYNGSDWDIAVGTRKADGICNGDVWVKKSTPLSEWELQSLGVDVTSVCFSPAYPTDKTIVAIASDNSTSYLCTGFRHTNTNTTTWNVTTPSKVDINELGEDSPAETEIIWSDLALPSNYSGSDGESRVLYASYSSNTTADDVYRIKDITVKRMDVNKGDNISIASIAYYGDYVEGRLLAGEVLGDVGSGTALIHICSNPAESFPEWAEPTKPPTGGAGSGCANAQLAWSSDGGVAYCGTSSNNVTNAGNWTLPGAWNGTAADESAFSISEDTGQKVWNQLSLIDTNMGKLCDYALSGDYETLYLASAGAGFDSLWRSRSAPLGKTWQRVLCFSSEGNNIILRHTPRGSDAEVIFFATVNSTDARYSLDEGQQWKRLWNCPYSVTDMAVVSNEMFYVLSDNLLAKAVWNKEGYVGMWEWDWDMETGLLHGYSLSVSGKDFVFVGDNGAEGKIAYSMDGGVTFNWTPAVSETGNMLVIPDEDFGSNRFIYAASDAFMSGVYRWAIRGSSSWKELHPSRPGFSGLAQRGGALYGAYGAGVVRTLIPHLGIVTADDWDTLAVGLVAGVAFRAGTLRARVNEDNIDLWAIDDRPYNFGAEVGCLWVYSDSFALKTPWPTSPAPAGLVPCNNCTCRARTFFFRWRELALAERYDLWIALDERFSQMIVKVENITPADIHGPTWCPESIALRIGCGSTYYWKVRSCSTTEGERVHSRWSPPVRFTVEVCSKIGGMHIAPVPEAPENGSYNVSRSPGFSWQGFPHTTKYEFILARDAALTQVIVHEEVSTSAYLYGGELDWDTIYFWQVRAIEPVLSEPSDAVAFTVMSQPSSVPVVAPAVAVVILPTPFWVWFIIGILALLAIVVIWFCLVGR